MERPLSVGDSRFLENHRIDHRWVYHRRGSERLETALAAMRNFDKWVLNGFRACSACKTGLRSRKGDCLHCSKQLEHVYRYTEAGSVYILYSPSARIIKLGSTLKDPLRRCHQLSAMGYGGAFDWKVSYTQVVHRCGLFEDWLKSALAPYCEYIPYERYGRSTYTRETYRCSRAAAKRVLIQTYRFYSLAYDNTCGL